MALVLENDDPVTLPRAALRFPLELRTPPNFVVDDPSTWPKVEGRIELVEGRLLFMPPCADTQQDVVADIVTELRNWSRQHPDFVVATNEAGMLLDGEVRGADAAVWTRAAAMPHTGLFRRVPPLLAVEVAGEDEGEPALRDKADWYLRHGVARVWLVLPATREVVVLGAAFDARFVQGDALPAIDALPGLAPEVRSFFAQLEEG